MNKINPHKLFLIDSLGALSSAILLGLVLARFENIFGIPQKVIYPLAIIACVLFVYSLLCSLSKTENWRVYMKVVAVANLLYCCLTIALIINMPQKPTNLGITYFVLEIITITILAILELRVATKFKYDQIS